MRSPIHGALGLFGTKPGEAGPIVFSNPCAADHEREACGEPRPEDGLYLARPDGNGKRQILSGFGANRPRFSPDGRWIVFQGGYQSFPDADLYRVNADGSGLRQLTSGPDRDTKAEFLADGRIIFASEKVGGPDGLFVMEPDGGKVERVTSAVGAASTDGRRIAVSRCDRKEEKERCSIYLYRPDGTLIRRLTEPARTDIDPVISPNGRLVAFQRALGYAGQAIFLVRSDGKGGAWPLPKPRDEEEKDFVRHDPVWSPDSRSILFREENRWNYHSESPSYFRYGVKPIKGGRAVFLTPEMGSYRRLLLEPDWGTRR
ncbi:MAG TPA: hypothetical protein VFN92_09465 [Solirubrobacterales bacterium]|nr:hypothetical protein [Solirubrobacterales bacterium]